MSISLVMEVMQAAAAAAIKIGMPILLLSLIIGLVIAVFQAATQIQEQTLTFVPKLITIAAILLVGGSWMLNKVVIFTQQIMNMIAN